MWRSDVRPFAHLASHKHMPSSKRLSADQRKVLSSLVCERFSATPGNVEVVKSFRNSKGELLLDYARSRGFREDAEGDSAFYIVKTRSGRGLLFFSLKCGELFSPLAPDELQKNATEYLALTQALYNASSPDVDRKAALRKLKAISQKKDLTLEDTVNSLFKNAKQKKMILANLNRDLLVEKNKKILRVATTYSGVQLVHFCSNQEAVDWWIGHGMSRTVGETVFWHFIVPIMLDVRTLVGCEYAFLFAADLTEDRQLINYYEQSLKFVQEKAMGANKPVYDFSCSFMCQPLKEIEARRRHFFEHFNDECMP